jgi:hypothetical protein
MMLNKTHRSILIFLGVLLILFSIYRIASQSDTMAFVDYLMQKFYIKTESSRAISGDPFINGGILIAAIDAYYEDNKKYPIGLKELTPKYIKLIPLPNWGNNDWDYERGDIPNSSGLNDPGTDKEFSLVVHVKSGGYQGWYYNNKTRRWTFSD